MKKLTLIIAWVLLFSLWGCGTPDNPLSPDDDLTNNAITEPAVLSKAATKFTVLLESYTYDIFGNLQVKRIGKSKLRVRFLARASTVPLDCGSNPSCEASVGETGSLVQAFDLVLSFNPGSGPINGDIKGQTQGRIHLQGGGACGSDFRGRVSGSFQAIDNGTPNFSASLQIKGRVQGGGKVVLKLPGRFEINGQQLVWKSLQGSGNLIDVTCAG